MIRQQSPVSTLWTTQYNQKWAQSTLGSLVKKPNQDVTMTLNEKTAALKIMSLDLSSSGRFWGQKWSLRTQVQYMHGLFHLRL